MLGRLSALSISSLCVLMPLCSAMSVFLVDEQLPDFNGLCHGDYA